MTVGVWVLGDQLSHSQAALRSCQSSQNPVILIESRDYIYQRRYHQQKLVLVWSAMRHFAQELTTAGWNVTYHIGADFLTPLQAWIEKYQITELRIVTPSDLPFADFLDTLSLSCEIKYFPNHNFLWTRQEFQSWAKTRKRLILEDFYRLGRKKFNILLEGKQPVGGKWNFDQQNRQPPQKNLHPPQPLSFKPDQITRTVIDWVKHFQFSDYGEIEPFNWGVTRQQALQVLDNFIAEGLPNFGTYQDAMVTGEYTMWHSLISPYLNLGLLQPLEVIKKIENAYYQNNLALNSVEGFIRQVLGWREYMYGIYHYAGTDYARSNWFNHTYPLPEFYWDAKQTKMNCLYQTLVQVEKTGYAHHIQRLMILSNFALIVGFSPQQIEKWFHSAFIDAYDWVMQTNVIGMGQFADGGLLASKPYAASANYINKMSDYCGNCQYNHRDRTGENACPFNFFYWDFLTRHQDLLKSQGRMNLMLANLKRIPAEELRQIQKLAEQWRDKFKSNQ